MNFAENSQEQAGFAENCTMDLTAENYSDRMIEWILQTDLLDISFSIADRHWMVSNCSNQNRMSVEAEEAAALGFDCMDVMQNIDRKLQIALEVEEEEAFHTAETVER